MERQEIKNNKRKTIKKVVIAVIAVILMFVISAVVATIIHRNMSAPVSGNVENGLSAYELAAEQGYDGSVEDWLNSLKGKSAYEIAAENGYSDRWIYHDELYSGSVQALSGGSFLLYIRTLRR